MRVRTALLIVVAVTTAAFVLINWRVFSIPANFNFVIGTIAIPIGVVMLGLLAAVILAFAVYIGIWQRTILLDHRRQSKELRTQRQLAAYPSQLTNLCKQRMSSRT